MDIALHKAHELGYDDHKPRLKEVRVNVSIVIKSFLENFNWIFFFVQIPIKEEYLESSRNRSSPSESSNLQSPNVNPHFFVII